MTLFSSLFKKGNTAAQTAPRQEASPTESVYLTPTVVFGHGDSSVYFVDENRGIRKMLVDPSGGILQFPGIVKENFWVKRISGNVLLPRILYRTSFERRENKWLMLWTVQPDGDYWRDEDGFGGENEDEIVLHTYVDENGNYTGPFRIYEINNVCYCLDRFEIAHTKYYATALQSLRAGTVEAHVDVLFPRLYGMGLYRGMRSVWEFYTLINRTLAEQYWAHPVLSHHLLETAEALLQLDMPIIEYPNDRIVQGCMTLFYEVSREQIFKEVLDRFFEGKPDEFTAKRLSL